MGMLKVMFEKGSHYPSDAKPLASLIKELDP